jgi:hypothetical protein
VRVRVRVRVCICVLSPPPPRFLGFVLKNRYILANCGAGIAILQDCGVVAFSLSSRVSRVGCGNERGEKRRRQNKKSGFRFLNRVRKGLGIARVCVKRRGKGPIDPPQRHGCKGWEGWEKQCGAELCAYHHGNHVEKEGFFVSSAEYSRFISFRSLIMRSEAGRLATLYFERVRKAQ